MASIEAAALQLRMKGNAMRLNILLAVLAAAVLAAFVVLYFVMSGGSGDEPENGLSIEEQSPRIEQKSDKEPTQADEETAPEVDGRQEAPVPEEAAEEAADPNDNNETARPIQPSAPDADAPDPFTVELQEAVDELNDVADRLVEQFPSGEAAAMADIFKGIGEALIKYNSELSGEEMTAENRVVNLKARLKNLTQSMREEVYAIQKSLPSDVEEAMNQFLEANRPKKFFALLGD